MKGISIRVSDELEAELEAYADAENVDKSAAVRKLLADELEKWRTDRALERFGAGEITHSQAADLAETSVWDFAVTAKEEGVTWVGGDHLESDLRDL